MNTRRHFVKAMAAMAAIPLIGCAEKAEEVRDVVDDDLEGMIDDTADEAGHHPDGPGDASGHWRMPDESEPHARTWMAFGARRDIWGGDLLPEVRRNLGAVALAIARYEPVSMLVRAEDMAVAKSLVGSDVDLVECALDDLWIRDTGPVFVRDGRGRLGGIDFNFNGWGGKQAHRHDAEVARFVTGLSRVAMVETSLVLEGGGIEVDGQGTALATESAILNKNRNPGLSKADCERELKRLLGVEKIIWLPGIRDKDITDGHIDFYARFARPGVVVAAYDSDPDSFDHAVTKRHLALLREAIDAHGRALDVVVLQAPVDVRERYAGDDFAAGYLNYYVCNGAVIAPQFGDAEADGTAKEALQRLFPDRDVVQVAIDGIAAGGGGIHCATQQQPQG
jgi:agmatine deiminase